MKCATPSKTKARTPQAAAPAASKIVLKPTSKILTPAELEIPKELAAKIDFVAIATPLILAGRRITPVHPMTKLGVMKNWDKHQITSLVELRKLAKYFPNHNVGCVGISGATYDRETGEWICGNDCFLDIDAEGELERIKRENPGKKLPRTYTVCSRPDTMKFKLHFYFRQTLYSISKFGKNIQVKDLTTFNEKGNHPVLYDMRGIGGAAFVVAAGSVRDDGQIYTVVDDSPIADIPDWLVDWIVADKARYDAEVNQERERDRVAKAKDRAKYTPQQRAQMRKDGLSEGFDIFKKDTYEFLMYKARHLASQGLIASLEVSLAELCSEFCEGGKEYAASDRGKMTIHKIANDPALVRGHAQMFYDRKEKPTFGKQETAPKSRHKKWVSIIKQLPDPVPVTEGYAALGITPAMAKLPKYRVAAGEARKDAGRMAINGVWISEESMKAEIANGCAHLNPSPLEKTSNTVLRFETREDALNFYADYASTLGDKFEFKLQRVPLKDGGGLAVELVPLEAAKEEEEVNA